MQNAKAALLEKVYQEHRVHARHIETLRSGVLSIINTVGGGVLAFATGDGISRHDWPTGLMVAVIGLFAMLFAVKFHEKLRLEMKFAAAALVAWENVLGISGTFDYSAKTKAAHAACHPIMDRIKMFWLWLGLATILSSTGLALIVLALLQPASPPGPKPSGDRKSATIVTADPDRCLAGRHPPGTALPRHQA